MAYSGFAAPGGAVYEIASPRMPYSGPIRGPLTHGCMIFVRGHIQHGCDRFKINLEAANGDIVLHLNPRFSEGCVVRNTCHGSWGGEERNGGMPLQQGGQMECIILVQEGHFKIAFNGQHFTDYNHRMPKESVSRLLVEGNVVLNNITFQGLPTPPPYTAMGIPEPLVKMPEPGTGPGFSYGQYGQGDTVVQHAPPPYGGAPYIPPAAGQFPMPGGVPPPYNPSAGQFPTPGGFPSPYQPPAGNAPAPGSAAGPPIYNPPIPFFGNISGGMHAGRDVHISGIPNHGAQRFAINLQCGQAGHNIPYHFNVRFDERCIVGNSMQKNNWGSEVRVQNVPFRPGQNFDLRIRCGPKKYKAFVGNQLLMEFPHRIHPVEKAVLLHITGDVKLTSVRL